MPLELARVAAQVAGLGQRLAAEGNPNLKGDALVAIYLAEAAARSAAELVRANAELGKLGPRLPDQADSCVSAAARAREQAGAAGPVPLQRRDSVRERWLGRVQRPRGAASAAFPRRLLLQ